MEFTLDKEPATKEEIRQEEIMLLKKHVKSSNIFNSIFVTIAIISTYLFFFKKMLLIPMLGIISLKLVYDIYIRNFKSQIKYELNQITAVESLHCPDALSLCQKYPELDDYRKKAVKDRELLHGEYLMMVEWDKAADSRKKEDEGKKAFSKLHEYTPWESGENNGRVKLEKCS